MKHAFIPALVLGALASALAAPPPGITEVMGTAGDREVEISADQRVTRAAARERRIELVFPDARTAKGTLFVVFEPSTGYFYWNVEWKKGDYPETSQLDHLASGSTFVGLTDRGLSLLNGGPCGLFIREARDKAQSIDAAYQEALSRASQHLGEIESYKNLYPKAYVDLRTGWPRGFVANGPRSEACPPIKLVHAEHVSEPWEFLGKPQTEGGWVLTYEANYKVRVTVADGIACPPSQMGCPALRGIACVDTQGHDKQCPEP